MADMDTNNSPTAPRKRKERSDKGHPRIKTSKIFRAEAKYRSKASEEVDTRLAKCISERAQVLETLAKFAYWQEKFNSLGREIETLIGYQQRLSGVPPGSVLPSPPTQVDPMSLMPSVPDPGTYSAFAPLPPGAGSIPAKQIRISPSQNVGDMVAGEGGFR